MTTTIQMPISNLPSSAEVRAASNSEMAEKAIEAWDRGELDAALFWVGAGVPDSIWVDTAREEVWLRSHYYPEHGGSPKPVKTSTKLGTSPAKAALAAHIIEVSRRRQDA